MSLRRFGEVCLIIANLILLAAIDQMALGGMVEDKILECFTIGLDAILLDITSLLHRLLIVMVPFLNQVGWPFVCDVIFLLLIYALIDGLCKAIVKKKDGGGKAHS
jgi:hypothetical protein